MIRTFLLFIFLMQNLLHAQELFISNSDLVQKDSVLDYFEDISNKLDIHAILEDSPFKQTLSLPVSLGFKINITQWLHLKITNNLPQKQKSIFFIKEGYALDYLRFYDVREKQLVKEEELGRYSSSLTKGAFAFSLNPNESTDIYIRVKGKTPILLSSTFSDQPTHQRAEMMYVAEHTLYLGIMLALLLYNFLLYFGLKQKEYLYYSLYIFAQMIWLVSISGIPDRFFHIANTHWSVYSTPFIMTFLLLFTQKVLGLKELLPFMYKLTKLFIVLMLFWIPFSFIVGLKVASPVISFLSLVITVGLVYIAFVSVQKKISVAKYYLVATGIYMLFLSMAILWLLGIGEYNEINRHSMFIGAILEGLLLSALLSYRFNCIRQDADLSTQKLQEERASREEILEEKIHEKTQALKINIQELEEISSTDVLTGVLNRRAFLQQADSVIQKFGDSKRLFLMLIDMDHFKKVNDSYGHDAGDEVLIYIAQTIEKDIKLDALFARIGGEEFALLVYDTSMEKAMQCARKLQELVAREPFVYHEKKIDLTLSIGLSAYDTGSLKEWLKQSDKALYQAKNEGRNRVVSI